MTQTLLPTPPEAQRVPERALRCYTQRWHCSTSAIATHGTPVPSAIQCRPISRHSSAQCQQVAAWRPALQCPVPPSTLPRRSRIDSKLLQEGSRWATCGAKSSNVYVEGSFELLGKINGEKTCLWVLLAHYVTVQCRPVLAWRPALQCPVPASAGLAAGAAVPSVGPPGRTGLQFPVHSGTVCAVGASAAA